MFILLSCVLHFFSVCIPESNEIVPNFNVKQKDRQAIGVNKFNNSNREHLLNDNDIHLPLTTKSPFVVSSMLFENVCSEDDLMRARTELKVLLISDFDSHQGIPVEANQPLGSPSPLINLTRPAVLRIYYGLSKSCTKSLNAIRPTYGPISTSSSVGMDPHNFTTKPMSLTLFNIGEQLRSYLKNQCEREVSKYLESKFNHCTILIYSGESNNGPSNSSLAYHSDCTFDHTGKFLPGRNSQQENTCVAVLTLGDTRTLHFKKRIAQSSKIGRKKWVQTDDKGVSFDLTDNSVFMLHPIDEKPCVREGDDHMSQYIHGGVKITNNNDLSIAFAFRVVSVDHEYDPVTSKLVAKEDFLKDSDTFLSDRNQRLRDCLRTFRCNELDSYSKHFHEFVDNKFKEWNW